MKKQIRVLVSLTIIAVLSVTAADAQIASNPPFTLEQSVIASGGGASSNNGFKIEGTIGQFAAGTTSTNSSFTLRSGFFTPELLAPTVASVSIEGRVRLENGAGVRNVIITLTESDGTIRTTSSGTFGAFRFAGVNVGQVVILNVTAKKYGFDQSFMVLNLIEQVAGLEFIALER